MQDPINEHREEMSKKFKNRVDYIDIAAYGISKVDLDDENIN